MLIDNTTRDPGDLGVLTVVSNKKTILKFYGPRNSSIRAARQLVLNLHTCEMIFFELHAMEGYRVEMREPIKPIAVYQSSIEDLSFVWDHAGSIYVPGTWDEATCCTNIKASIRFSA